LGKGGKGKGKKSKVINLDKENSDDSDADRDGADADDDEDLETMEGQVKANYTLINAILRSCVRCGPQKMCKINAKNQHDNNITYQMVRSWATSYVSATLSDVDNCSCKTCRLLGMRV
jgi:hypothetical protein